MRKHHHSTMKFHTIYTLLLTLAFVVVLYFSQNFTLGLIMLFLLFYIAGNGIIHSRKNELHRDTLLEYVLIAMIVLVLLLGSMI